LEKFEIKPEKIEVWDLNPEVETKIRSLKVNFQHKDTLLETNFGKNEDIQGSLLFEDPATKYDFIVGNPPYLSKNSQYIKQNKKRLGQIYQEIGANDTYSMFLYLACHLLKDGGELVFIISDTFLTLGVFKKLRQFLLKNFTIEQIILCPSNLFEKATVNTCIIHQKNQQPNSQNQENQIIFNDCRQNQIGDYQGKISQIPQKNILKFPDSVFVFNGNSNLLDKIKKFVLKEHFLTIFQKALILN
jgi:type I restriction-modification system DNA methylase subunit